MFQFAEYMLDPQCVELRRDGAIVHVEKQVFDVLLYLVKHRERVVSKNELLDAVWGDRFVGASALTSRLKAARRAIGDDGKRQGRIATIHGVGYRFVADVRETGTQAPDGRQSQQIRYCRSQSGVQIAYATSGSGAPLVKAANWLTHLDLEWESPIWSHWIDVLSSQHQLIRYDQRGSGLSDWEVEDFSLDVWVEDLELVVEAAGVDRFPLLGISQGGAVAIEYAVRHPERVTRLALIGAYSKGRLSRADTAEQREEAQLDMAVGRVAWRREDAPYRRVFATQFLPDADRETWDAFTSLRLATTSPENAARFIDTFAHIDIGERAELVRAPTLILHSRDDRRVPASQARQLATLIPHSQLQLLNSSNHLLTATEPAWPLAKKTLGHFLSMEE